MCYFAIHLTYRPIECVISESNFQVASDLAIFNTSASTVRTAHEARDAHTRHLPASPLEQYAAVTTKLLYESLGLLHVTNRDYVGTVADLGRTMEDLTRIGSQVRV